MVHLIFAQFEVASRYSPRTPVALELSLAAAHQVEQERTALTKLWQQHREQTVYEAERSASPVRATPSSQKTAR